MKYKVGDRVRIKSIDWYNQMSCIPNKIFGADDCICIKCGVRSFTKAMCKFCGRVMTIQEVIGIYVYRMKEDMLGYEFTDEMIEGLVEESDDFEKMCIESEKRYEEEYSKGEYCHEQSFKWGFQEGYNYSHENDKLEISLKEGYQFKDENGNVINATKIVLEKKKPKYPKTYEECLHELDIHECVAACGWKKEIKAFQTLLVCRDTYWKIAGDEMGLGKPWEPDWKAYDKKYVIGMHEDMIYQDTETRNNKILAFPTAEMRDAFYENFKELIESCKELL